MLILLDFFFRTWCRCPVAVPVSLCFMVEPSPPHKLDVIAMLKQVFMSPCMVPPHLSGSLPSSSTQTRIHHLKPGLPEAWSVLLFPIYSPSLLRTHCSAMAQTKNVHDLRSNNRYGNQIKLQRSQDLCGDEDLMCFALGSLPSNSLPYFWQ